jgi:glycosyltransferase involved in cell wall biosynthesis
MPRVLFFSFYTGLGGGETSLLSLLGSLGRRRYEPVLICPREGQLTESARALGVEVHIIPYRGASIWFVPFIWRHLMNVRRFEAVTPRLAPALVHSDFHSLPYALPVCNRLKIPLIFTCYGWWFHPKPWQRGFYRTGPQRILAISEAVKQGFLGKPPFMQPDKVRVLNLGVDIDLFRPRTAERVAIRRELGLSLQSPLVTLIGRFQRVKAHDVFLAAAKIVGQQSPATRFAIAGENVFGGSADEAYKRQVVSMAKADPELNQKVAFLGWVPEAERLLAASDVVVCSSYFESFGMVVIEAMASGVPVVSTNVGGPAETMMDGETGYLVQPGRPDLIADRVLRLLADEDLRDRMGQAGRERVKLNFSLEQYAAGFSETLESLRAGNEHIGI